MTLYVRMYVCIHVQKLNESSESLKSVQAFQGGVPEAHSRESPLAGILFTVYVVSRSPTYKHDISQ